MKFYMKVITFGRNDNNDVIINDQFVGRNHCQIVESDVNKPDTSKSNTCAPNWNINSPDFV